MLEMTRVISFFIVFPMKFIKAAPPAFTIGATHQNKTRDSFADPAHLLREFLSHRSCATSHVSYLGWNLRSLYSSSAGCRRCPAPCGLAHGFALKIEARNSTIKFKTYHAMRLCRTQKSIFASLAFGKRLVFHFEFFTVRTQWTRASSPWWFSCSFSSSDLTPPCCSCPVLCHSLTSSFMHKENHQCQNQKISATNSQFSLRSAALKIHRNKWQASSYFFMVFSMQFSKTAQYHDATNSTHCLFFSWYFPWISQKRLGTKMLQITRVISFFRGISHENHQNGSVPWCYK